MDISISIPAWVMWLAGGSAALVILGLAIFGFVVLRTLPGGGWYR